MNTPDQANYCDHCGELMQTQTTWNFASVPWDTASANAGESACLCGDCVSDLTKRAKVYNIMARNSNV